MLLRHWNLPSEFQIMTRFQPTPQLSQEERRETSILHIAHAYAHKKFISKYKLPFTLLSDRDRKVMEKYGAYGEKIMYGKKTTGVIRSTVWIGPDGKVKKHWAKIASAEKHPAKVLDELKARK